MIDEPLAEFMLKQRKRVQHRLVVLGRRIRARQDELTVDLDEETSNIAGISGFSMTSAMGRKKPTLGQIERDPS